MKRKTKAQREAEQLAALTQRIRDVYSGAGEEAWPEEEDERWPSATELSRIVPTLKALFGDDTNEWLFGIRALDKYEQPSALAKWLFENGVRA